MKIVEREDTPNTMESANNMLGRLAKVHLKEL